MVSRHRAPVRGEIWWVDFNPSRGSEQAGKRPAVIFSDTGFNQMQHRILVVLPMSSTVREFEFHVFAATEHTGLRSPGVIMCDQILTIATDRLLDSTPVGYVTDELLARVEDRVALILSLPSPKTNVT